METLENNIEVHLYNLHKKVWSGNSFNARRYEEYALAVWDYMRNGIEVGEHERFVSHYKVFVQKVKGERQ